jgi:hypothetical protein
VNKKSPKYTLDIKRKAVEEFVSGLKTAQQIAAELGGIKIVTVFIIGNHFLKRIKKLKKN